MRDFIQKHFRTDKHFYTTVFSITIPIALQNIISLSVNLMDIIMLGQLGDLAITAANLGGQPFFILNILGFGLASGANVLIAQYWGKGDMHRIRCLLALSLRVVVFASALFTIAGIFFPYQLMSIFSNDTAAINASAEYLSTLAFSFLLFSFSNCYLMCLRAVEQVKVSMAIYSCSFFINVFFNWCFIFGQLGFPVYGIRGAAMGTVMARAFEFVAVVIYMLFFEKRIQFKPFHLFQKTEGLLGDYLKNSAPVVGNELLWGLGMAVINMTIGRMGTSFMAAASIANVMNQLCSVFTFGIANAAAVLCGKTIGSGKSRKESQRVANSLLVVGEILSLCAGLLLLSLRGPILALYDVTPEAHSIAFSLLTILGCLEPIMGFGCVCIVGVLRGGGDVNANFLLDCGLLWVQAVPLGLLGAFVFHWSAPVVFFAMRSDNIIKVIIALPRILSGKWIRNITRN